MIYISYLPHCCDKILDRNNLREEGFVGSWFHSIEAMVAWLHALEQAIMAMGGVSSPHGGQEAERER
jgi:hypothetical protein